MQQGEIVLVPFPFTDLSTTKTRPALIISNQKLNSEDIILCGITSQSCSPQIPLTNKDLLQGELPIKSYIKPTKIVTLNKKLIRKTVAKINQEKLEKTIQAIHRILKQSHRKTA